MNVSQVFWEIYIKRDQVFLGFMHSFTGLELKGFGIKTDSEVYIKMSSFAFFSSFFLNKYNLP